jgi:hypothetical protein
VRRPSLLAVSALIPFLALATLNSAGYRYGASDQAFYVPAILSQLDPALFPRDSDLIQSQARLTVMDEAVAGAVRLTKLSLPTLFGVLYVAALAVLMWGAVRIGGLIYQTTWATAALLAALTLRHAIMKSGTNTLEGYFHPRQLAFGLGVIALTTFLRSGPGRAAIPLVLAALLHPTTALWFVIWLGVATYVSERHLRFALVATAAVGAVVGAWALIAGPFAGRLAPIDDAWLATLANKEYLFPHDWPPAAWFVNLAYVPLILWLYSRRRAAGLAGPRERAMVIGLMSLVAVFAIALIVQSARVALAYQLQPGRIFWMLDFVATIYAVWALAEMNGRSERRAMIVALTIAALSCVRGAYVLLVRFPDRAVVEIGVRDDDWGRVMAWARSSDESSHWLADPYHAGRYGTSVRVAGQRDVFVEEIKDTAIGMYDRPVAMRTRDRLEAIGEFSALTPARARELAAEYGIDYLVTEQPMDLPLAFSSGRLRVYRLR